VNLRKVELVKSFEVELVIFHHLLNILEKFFSASFGLQIFIIPDYF